MKLFTLFVSVVLLCIFSLAAPSVYAFEIKNGDSIRIEKDQVVEGSLYAAGNSVVVEGVVHGDVLCAGQQISISGTVDGDVICAGQTLSVGGIISGNVRVIGQNIAVSAKVTRNLSVVSQSLDITSSGVIMGEVLSAGESLVVDGVIEKTLMSAYRAVAVNGLVNGNMKLAVDSLTLGGKAKVSGTIDYTSERDALVPASASVSGSIVRTAPPKHEKPVAKRAPVRSSWPSNAWPSIVFYLILGLLTVVVFPKYVVRVTTAMAKDAVPVGLKGALILMATPVAMMILFITILGIPFSFALLMLYVMGIAVCRIFVAAIVGAYILYRFEAKQKANVFLQILIGVPVLWFIFKMPFIGGFVGFLAVCWGLGGMYLGFKSTKK